MKIELDKPVKVIICGYNASGKTTLAKALIERFSGNVFLYDWHNEYVDIKKNNAVQYVPKFKDELERRRTELNDVLRKMFINKPEFQLLVIDEANEYEPNRMQLTSSMLDIYDNHAHYNQSSLLICRRPSDINTKLVEIAHYRIFFRLDGKNDIQYLNGIKGGLGDAVSSLGKYEFIVLDNFGTMVVCNPISL